MKSGILLSSKTLSGILAASAVALSLATAACGSDSLLSDGRTSFADDANQNGNPNNGIDAGVDVGSPSTDASKNGNPYVYDAAVGSGTTVDANANPVATIDAAMNPTTRSDAAPALPDAANVGPTGSTGQNPAPIDAGAQAAIDAAGFTGSVTPDPGAVNSVDAGVADASDSNGGAGGSSGGGILGGTGGPGDSGGAGGVGGTGGGAPLDAAAPAPPPTLQEDCTYRWGTITDHDSNVQVFSTNTSVLVSGFRFDGDVATQSFSEKDGAQLWMNSEGAFGGDNSGTDTGIFMSCGGGEQCINKVDLTSGKEEHSSDYMAVTAGWAGGLGGRMAVQPSGEFLIGDFDYPETWWTWEQTSQWETSIDGVSLSDSGPGSVLFRHNADNSFAGYLNLPSTYVSSVTALSDGRWTVILTNQTNDDMDVLGVTLPANTTNMVTFAADLSSAMLDQTGTGWQSYNVPYTTLRVTSDANDGSAIAYNDKGLAWRSPANCGGTVIGASSSDVFVTTSVSTGETYCGYQLVSDVAGSGFAVVQLNAATGKVDSVRWMRSSLQSASGSVSNDGDLYLDGYNQTELTVCDETIATASQGGTALLAVSGTPTTPVDDACSTKNGGCDPLTACEMSDGAPRCGVCPIGYAGDGVNGCIALDACANNNGGCDSLTTCSSSAGVATCGSCPDGYAGTGASGCRPATCEALTGIYLSDDHAIDGAGNALAFYSSSNISPNATIFAQADWTVPAGTRIIDEAYGYHGEQPYIPATSCYATLAGNVFCSGDNSAGQLGGGNIDASNGNGATVEVLKNDGTVLDDVVHLVGANAAFFVLRSDGSVWAWGHNGHGELGVGDTTDRATAQLVIASGVSKIISGQDPIGNGNVQARACALMSADGSIQCWGTTGFSWDNGAGSTDPQVTPLTVMLGDGSGPLTGITNLGGNTDAATASGSGFHTCGTKDDGTLWCFGIFGPAFAMSDIPNKGADAWQAASGVTSFFSHPWGTCWTSTDTTVWCTGASQRGENGGTDDFEGQYTPVQIYDGNGALLTGAVQVVGGIYQSSCALKSDGTVWCWGERYNVDGSDNRGISAMQVTLQGQPLTDVQQLMAPTNNGEALYIAVTSSHTYVGTEYNNYAAHELDCSSN